VTFSGSATDDKNLDYVEISLKNSTTRENLSADGAWSTSVVAGWFRVSPTSGLNTSSYNWSWTTPFPLSPGNYSFAVRATDDEGITTATANQGKLTINAQVPGDAYPDGTITPTGTNTGGSMHLDLAGAASDDKGVTAVRVTLRDSISAQYVQPNGTMGAAYATLDATLASPGATSTAWRLPLDLPAQGNFTVTAFAVDTAGQQDPDTKTATSQWMVFPGDQPPTSTDLLLAPTEGTIFTGARVFVSGRLEDDQQIAQAQIAVVNAAGQYMNTAGGFTSTAESWRTAYLNSPGSAGSNFSYTTPPIPAGSYTVYVRGVDQHGLVTPVANYGVRHVTVAPPASNPPVAKVVVGCQQNVCTFDGRTSTDENTATLTYAWNFGDGTTGTGPVATKTYTRAGTFTVTLTTTDEFALTGTTTTTVTITEPTGNVAPTPVLNPPACSGLVCNFSAVGSADPNVGDTISYAWDFGDKTAGGTASAMAHTFPAAGTYTVTLSTTDGWGRRASATRTVTVG
jgi:PKD repeat protein